MERFTKIRFVPFILGLIVLVTGLCLKYILQTYPEYTIIKWGVFLTVAGFIFLQAIRQTIREKPEKEQTPEPGKSIREIAEGDLMDELYQIKNRGLPASFIRHFLGTLITLASIPLIIVNKEYLFGSILFVVSVILNLISWKWTKEYLKRHKELKIILKDNSKFIKETKEEKKKVITLCIMLIILTIIGIIGIKIIENILEKTI
jgi:hypothetical protein